MAVNGIEPSALNMGALQEESSRQRVLSSGTDAANFSNAAKNLARSGDGMAGNVATATQGLNGKKVVYDFASGSLSINNVKLDLKGFVRGSKDDFAVQEEAGGYRVWNLSNNTSALVDAQGKLVPAEEGDPQPALDPAAEMVLVNNSGNYTSAVSNAGMTVFSRKPGALINTGGGNDMVFALNGISGSVSMGGGDDALYTSKITTGSVDMGDGDAYVQTRSATGGTLNAGKDGDFYLDAARGTLGGINIQAGPGAGMVEINTKGMNGTRADLSAAGQVTLNVQGNVGGNSELRLGQNLNDVTISGAFSSSQLQAGQSSATTFRSGSIGGSGGSMLLGDSGNEISVRGAVSGVSINMGAGANRFYAGRITGTAKNQVLLNMGGAGAAEQTVRVSGASNQFVYQGGAGDDNLTLQGAVSNSVLNLGDGANSVDLSKPKNKTAAFGFSNTSIYATGSGATSVTAGSFSGKQESASISLGDGGNLLNFTGRVSKADISMGAGENTLNAGSLSGTKNFSVKLDMGRGAASTQTVNVSGTVNYLQYTGGDGVDQLKILGSLTNSDIELGEGSNSITMRGKRHAAAAEKAYNIASSSIRSGDDSTRIEAAAITGTGNAPTSIILGNGNNSVNLSGKISGTSLVMGTGENMLNAKGVNGNARTGVSIEMRGTGSNTMNISGAASFLTYQGGSGDDIITLLGNLNKSDLDLDGGSNSLTMSGSLNGGKEKAYTINSSKIVAEGDGDSFNTIRAGAVTGKADWGSQIKLGDGTNLVNLAGKLSSAVISMGTGSNTLYAKGVGGTARNTVDIDMGGTEESTAANTVGITGAVSYLNYTGRAGNDDLTILGQLANSKLNLGSGANSLLMKGKTTPTAKETAYGIRSSTITTDNDGDASLAVTAGAVTGSARNQSIFELGAGGNVLDLVSLGYTGISVGGGMTLNVDKLTSLNLDMGSVSNTINVRKGLGGAGAAGVTLRSSQASSGATQTIRVTGATNNLTYIGGDGADILDLGGNVSSSSINLGSGADSLTTTNATNAAQGVLRGTTIKAGGEATTIAVNGMANIGSLLSAIESTTSSGTLNLTVTGTMSGTAMRLGGQKAVLNLGTVTSGTSVSSRVNIAGNNLDSVELTAKNVYGANFFFTSSRSVSVTVDEALTSTNVLLGSGASSVVAGSVDRTRLNMGDSTEAGITAGRIIRSEIVLTGAGNNVLRADSMEGPNNSVYLGGQAGSVNIMEVSGSMADTTVILGSAGSNNVVAGSILGGRILSADGSQADNAVTAASLDNAVISLMGRNNLVDAAAVNGSTLGFSGDNNTFGRATGGATVTGSRIIMQNGNNAIYAQSLGGRVELGGSTSLLSVSRELAADIVLGAGDHVLGVAGQTQWKGGSVTLGDESPYTGSATIRGLQMDGTSLSATGAATGSADVDISGSVNNAHLDFGLLNATYAADSTTDSTIAMNGSVNSLRSNDINNSSISMSGGSSVLLAGNVRGSAVSMAGQRGEFYTGSLQDSTVGMSAQRNLANFTGNTAGMSTSNGNAATVNSHLSFQGNNEVTLGAMLGGSLRLDGTSLLYARSVSGTEIDASGANTLRMGTLGGNLRLHGTDASSVVIGSIHDALFQGSAQGRVSAAITNIGAGSTVALSQSLGDTLVTATNFTDTSASTISSVSDLTGTAGLTIDPALTMESGLR